MRGFLGWVRRARWALVTVIVAAWSPWVVSIGLNDSLKQTVKDVAAKNDVTWGMYELLADAAVVPLSAFLLVALLLLGAAAVYIAVEVFRRKWNGYRHRRSEILLRRRAAGRWPAGSAR
jgi:hypothetical protein